MNIELRKLGFTDDMVERYRELEDKEWEAYRRLVDGLKCSGGSGMERVRRGQEIYCFRLEMVNLLKEGLDRMVQSG